jgi:hypothetical protein
MTADWTQRENVLSNKLPRLGRPYMGPRTVPRCLHSSSQCLQLPCRKFTHEIPKLTRMKQPTQVTGLHISKQGLRWLVFVRPDIISRIVTVSSAQRHCRFGVTCHTCPPSYRSRQLFEFVATVIGLDPWNRTNSIILTISFQSALTYLPSPPPHGMHGLPSLNQFQRVI